MPAAPSEIATTGYVRSTPLFATRARTLDPAQIARQAWKGYLTHQPEPWGTAIDGTPTLRFHFDNRALPWPSLKHHSVDGFDNNNRNLGAHALLHAMFGRQKSNDPAEKGQIAYLLSCTDPIIGIPYSPDTLPRSWAVGHGELAKNLMLMYQYTGNTRMRDWAAKMISTLRRYAVIENSPGIGKIAWYRQGMYAVGDPPAATSADPTMGGWQHLGVGWNLWAFAKWYELTGDKSSLDMALALANRLTNSTDPEGNDGSLRPDGSFGGKKAESSASWHMHGHTHGLPGLALLGEQLIKAGNRQAGLKCLDQTRKTFDWLYDPTRNPDAGSMTGWLGEWLMVATGWDRRADCEGCTMGDMVQTSTALAHASRLSPSLSAYDTYYDRAEQIFRGQLVEQMFRVTPRYLQVVKECLTKRVDRDLPEAAPQIRAAEVAKRYSVAVKTASRMVGQQLGTCGFADWANELPSDLDPALPGIHMQGCCADATIRAAHAIWAETVTGTRAEARVNMAFNRESSLLDVISCLPHRGEVDILVKTARKVLVRTPEWAPKDRVKTYVDRKPAAVRWSGSYVVFPITKRGQQLTVTYPVRIAEVKETPGSLAGVRFTEKWRGNTIVDIAPGGKWIPMFHRPELDTERVPM